MTSAVRHARTHPQLVMRSMLFVPADSERKIAKALETAADVLILDLEDAVAPSAKNSARTIVCEVLRAERRKPIAVRVNAADTPWHLHDLAALVGLRPDIVMLPKCNGRSDVRRLSDQCDVLEISAGIPAGVAATMPLVTETAAALAGMDYREAGDRLCALGFAGEDLSADLGVDARDTAGMNPLLAAARASVTLAGAAAGVPAIDTPFPDPRDETALTRECLEAARLGFAGKMCIHPNQIDTVHRAFEPSEARIEWAEAVVAALASSGGGVTLLDGKMIDHAHLRLAQRYLRLRDAVNLTK